MRVSAFLPPEHLRDIAEDVPTEYACVEAGGDADGGSRHVRHRSVAGLSVPLPFLLHSYLPAPPLSLPLRYEDALKLYNGILEKDSTCAEIWRRKVAVLKAQKDVDGAIKEMNEYLKVYVIYQVELAFCQHSLCVSAVWVLSFRLSWDSKQSPC